MSRPLAADGDLLFVYGTLLSTERGVMGSAERRLLRWLATRIGRATMPGRMWHRGRYPVAQAGVGRVPVIHGEVWRLRVPRRLMPILEVYEDTAGLLPEYVRVRRDVCLTNRRCVSAWVYLFAGSTSGLPPIAGGHWRG